MKKSIGFFLAAAALLTTSSLVPASLSAQVYAGDTNTLCTFLDLSNVTVTRCSGFWDGNLGNVDAGNQSNAAQNEALNDLGVDTPVPVLEKFDLSGGYVDFATLLFGPTVVGFHWGGGVFNALYPNNTFGSGSAFYLFDAGTTGLDRVYFSSAMTQSISNATLFLTGDDPGGPQDIVPEPATMSLLAMGLAGMAAASRRRRKQ